MRLQAVLTMLPGEGDTIGVMARLGWRFDPKTDGYRKGELWVSQSQAGEAVANARAGRRVLADGEMPFGDQEYARQPEPLSETFAEIIVASGLNNA